MEKLQEILSSLADLAGLVPDSELRRRIEEQVQLARQRASKGRPRSDLERAERIQIALEAGLSIPDIAHQMEIGERHAYRLRRLALLSPEERGWMRSYSLTESHVRQLQRLKPREQMVSLLRAVGERRMNSEQVRRLVDACRGLSDRSRVRVFSELVKVECNSTDLRSEELSGGGGEP